MLAFALSIIGYGTAVVKAVFKWLSRRSLAEIACIACGCVCIALFIDLKHWKSVATQRQAQLVAVQAQLKAISSNAKKAGDDGKQISKDVRNKNDAENSRIAGDAQSVRVRGPGKALCRPAPAASGGHEQAAPQPDVTGPALPPADSAAVPWNWLTDRAEEHDQAIAENRAWREWYQRLLAAWPK